jgi:hypothetical protein
MKEDIISQKLRRELSNLPIDTEPRVLYVLVEIRKILEHENKNSRDNLLIFYCDWVVHTKMDRFQSQKIFDIINKDGVESSQIISFNNLKAELRTFLEEKDLPTELVNNYWEPFKENLIDILVDTPIEKKGPVGAFYYQRRSGSGIEFCFIDNNGLVSLRKIIG